jgi:phosphatidylserine synthase
MGPMKYNTAESNDGSLPKEKQRHLFFLGAVVVSAVFMINVVLFYGYQLSTPHYAVIRILAPLLTVGLTMMDTLVLRSICRKQFPTNPELLKKWPINVPLYPTRPYYVYLVLRFTISGYLLSRL